jgi:hypothetical protein
VSAQAIVEEVGPERFAFADRVRGEEDREVAMRGRHDVAAPVRVAALELPMVGERVADAREAGVTATSQTAPEMPGTSDSSCCA